MADGHRQGVGDQLVRMWLASCQPVTIRGGQVDHRRKDASRALLGVTQAARGSRDLLCVVIPEEMERVRPQLEVSAAQGLGALARDHTRQ